jgi:hypothetical protein
MGLALSLAACASAPSPPQGAAREGTARDIQAVAARVAQVADDASYLPVQLHGRWVLPGPGSWLQPVLSDTSTPFRLAYPCTVLDGSLIPGIRSFMTRQISLTFTTHAASVLDATLEQRLARAASTTCGEGAGGVVSGPPGPILDRLEITHTTTTGATAVVKGQVHVTDWQGGVSHTSAPGGGRLVSWARVPGLLDATIHLRRGADGQWRAQSYAWSFAPGHEP